MLKLQKMEIIKTDIEGLLIIKPRIFEDERGFFYESWSKESFSTNGIDINFVQDNQSLSSKGVIRGLHFKILRLLGKLVRVISGLF